MKTVLALAAAFALAVALVPVATAAEDEDEKDVDRNSSCFVCAPGGRSGCNECKYDGHDSKGRRGSCQALGCTITGTKHCSTKKDVKVCTPLN